MSLFRRAVLYLGLGADEEYDDFGAPSRPADSRPGPALQGPERAAPPPQDASASGAVRVVNPEPAVRAVPDYEPDAGPGADGGQSVRTVPSPSQVKPTVVTPQSYNDAKEIGDVFKDQRPVIINLQQLRGDLAHRLVDFASGMVYALDGHMEKVTHNVFLLTPANIEVSDADRRRIGID